MVTTTTRVTVQSLEDLIAHSVSALFRRFHLNRDVIIGLVGERGSGKSLGGSNIGVRDYGISREPIWSNMNIKLNVNVPDEQANLFGLDGGIITYGSEPMDKQAFLQLDSRYEGGCLFFDEFNLEYGEARRSTANVNLMTDRAVQQLRKLQCALIYTVLDEMYVDVRIRDNTDVFIRCIDTAFKTANLAAGMQQGVAFEWMIYAMSPKLFGIDNTYAKTGKPIGPIPITLKDMWGSIDTFERQAEGQMKYSVQPKQLVPVDMVEDPKTRVERDKWGPLKERIEVFFNNHAGDGDEIEISSTDFRQELGIEKNMWPTVVKELYNILPNLDSKGNGTRRSPTKFMLPNRILV